MTARLLKLMTPPFGKLAAEQGAREGNLRFVHARLITHAEEIAFYGGHEIEKVEKILLSEGLLIPLVGTQAGVPVARQAHEHHLQGAHPVHHGGGLPHEVCVERCWPRHDCSPDLC